MKNVIYVTIILFMSFLFQSFVGEKSVPLFSKSNNYLFFDNIQSNSYFPTYDFNGKELTAGEIHNIVLEDVLRNVNIKTIYDINAYLNEHYNINIKNADIYKYPFYFITNSNKIGNDLKTYVDNVKSQISTIKNVIDKQNTILELAVNLKKSNFNELDKITILNSLSVYYSSIEFWNKGYGSKIKSNKAQTRDCGGEVAGTDWASAVIGGALGANPVSAFFGAVLGSAWEYATNEDCFE